jgi:hypothetical protein
MTVPDDDDGGDNDRGDFIISLPVVFEASQIRPLEHRPAQTHTNT